MVLQNTLHDMWLIHDREINYCIQDWLHENTHVVRCMHLKECMSISLGTRIALVFIWKNTFYKMYDLTAARDIVQVLYHNHYHLLAPILKTY